MELELVRKRRNFSRTAKLASMTKSAIIIGAGIGGLTAAIKLADAGMLVTVVEKLDRPGGKMGEYRLDGYRWDTGPSVITMKHIFAALFAESNRRIEDYIELVPLDPITRYRWPDGTLLDAVSDQDSMHVNMRQSGFSNKDIDGYDKFLHYAGEIYSAVRLPFLERSQPTIKEILRLPVRDIFKIDALRNMHAAISAHTTNPKLIQLLSRFATYVGSNPFQSPATLNVIAHVELSMGAWYPRGGVYQLALALERLAIEKGVQFQYGTPCQRIVTANGVTKGVLVGDNNPLFGDTVICDADHTWAHENLISAASTKESNLRHKHHERDPISERSPEPSSSGFVMLMKASINHAELRHHNIFFCPQNSSKTEYSHIFDKLIPPTDPTIYVCATNKTDTKHAPEGRSNWFVMVNAPYITKYSNWSVDSIGYGQEIDSTMTSRFGLSGSREVVQYWTPNTFQSTYNGNKGAIYGISSNSRLAAFKRAANRAPDIRGLYFSGGSVHPGGGVPLAVLSGTAAALCAISDFDRYG